MAGNLDSPGTQPSAGSGMYTLQGLYDYLVNGVTPAISGIFQEPAAGPGSTGKTTKDIYEGVKALFDAANATADKVLDSATFFSTDPANWGPKVGTMTTRTLSAVSASVLEGFYNATTLDAVDADLAAVNIKSGVNLFGVDGNYPIAAVEKTGQTSCWDESGNSISCAGTGQDGEYQKGATPPSPRFTDNGDGTVTDNMTGLIWLKDADCLENSGGIDKTMGYLTWANALTWSNNLANGSCGLSDGSAAGDWRLPNRKELLSLLDLETYDPALPSGHPFTNIQLSKYWSGSALSKYPDSAWYVSFDEGASNGYYKTSAYYVWPVHGGQ